MIVVLGDTFVSAEQCAESALEEWVQRQGSSQAETLRVWSKGRKIYERDLASERPNIAQLYLDAKKSRDHYAMSFERIDQPVGQSLRPRNISLQEPKVSKEPIR
jgi:hypothetical protein